MNQNIRVTILVDNRASEGLKAEHGFALWIETDGKKILLDTGQGPALVYNASQLGIDLKTTDMVVLSHGHYDHSGGLAEVLALAPGARVLAHAGVTRERFSVGPEGSRRIGMPPESLAAFEAMQPERLYFVKASLYLSDRVGLTGPIPRLTDFEDTGGPFFLDEQGKTADPIEDDLAIWVRTPGGLVVLVGCAHAGLINTLNHIMNLERGLSLRTVLGGFHLRTASELRLTRTLTALKQASPQLVVPCHCTGLAAMTAFGKELAQQCVWGSVGEVRV